MLGIDGAKSQRHIRHDGVQMLNRVLARRGRRLPPRELVLPVHARAALEAVFGTSIAHVRVIEHARHWMLWHPRVAATTRPGRILLRGAAEAFLADAPLLLEEYFHVLRQWDTGTLTRARYALQSLRHGYARNPFEIEAKRFARERASVYRACCAQFRTNPPPTGQ